MPPYEIIIITILINIIMRIYNIKLCNVMFSMHANQSKQQHQCVRVHNSTNCISLAFQGSYRWVYRVNYLLIGNGCASGGTGSRSARKR